MTDLINTISAKILHFLKSRSNIFGILILIIIFDLVINLLIFTFKPQVFVKRAGEVSQVAFVDVILPTATSTPYKPIQPTDALPLELPASTATLTTTPTPTPQAITEFYGFDFHPGSPQVIIQIRPVNKKVNNGKPIVIKVRPGSSCYYEDHRACVGAFLNSQSENVVFVTVHSGIGGEAESYRRAVEGRGLNRAAYSLKRIKDNLSGLDGAQVKISQGGRVSEEFQLLGTARVHPTRLAEYFRLPIGEALELSASLDPTFTTHLAPDRPMLIFETCGWKLPSEPWAPGVSDTTGSIYLGLIQKSP